MGGRSIPASPPRVAFSGMVSTCRPAREDEIYVMEAFASHASHCPRCADPWRTYLANDTLCERGHAKARDVAQYIYNKAGLPFSVTDRKRTSDRVQIEIPAGCQSVRGLLKAINQGLRIREKAEGSRASVSQDPRYYVPERSAPVRRNDADVYEIRPAGSRRENDRGSRETRYVEGKGSLYRRDEMERQQRSSRGEMKPVIIVAEPRGARRYNR